MSQIKYKMIVLLGVVGVSLSAVFVKYADAPSAVLAFYRLFFATILLIPMFWKNCREEIKAVEKKDLLLCCLSGFFLACHFTSYFESIRFTSIASSTVLVDTEVFFVAIVAVLVWKEKIGRMGILGILLTFAGSVVLAMSDRQAGSNALYGDVLALAGAVFVSVYTLIGKKQRKGMSTTLYTFIVYAASSVTLAIFCLIGKLSLTGYAPKDYACALGMTVFCTLLGHSVFSWGLKYLPAAFITTAKLGEPVFATILAILLFGQIPDLLKVIGGVLVIVGIWVYMLLEKNETDGKKA